LGKLTHLNENAMPQIVNVGTKEMTHRVARARTVIEVPSSIAILFKDGDLHSKKGPVFATAIIAGTMAAKKTFELIPLCHQIPLEHCDIHITLQNQNHIVIESQVSTHYKTGVEMEALVASSIAALTVYDMCKAISHDMTITQTKLISKSGGKSDFIEKTQSLPDE